MIETAPVLTEVAVCFSPAEGRFVARCVARVATPDGGMATGAYRSPLTRAQLVAHSDGPELADFLAAHPGLWWRLPVRAEEGHAL